MKEQIVLFLFLLIFFHQNGFAQLEDEPNNSFSEADTIQLVNLTGMIRGSIDPVRDVDYYVVEIARPGVFNINITDVPPNIIMRMTMSLTDQSDLPPVKGTRAGQALTFKQLVCQTGTYWFKLEDGNNVRKSSDGLYTLKISLDTSDQYECNNTVNSATCISLDSCYQGQINSKNDVDFYKVEIPRPGVFNISISNVPSNIEMRVTMLLTDQSEFRIVEGRNGQAVTFRQLVCQPGTYWFKLEDGNNVRKSSDGLYTLKISLDTSDQYECNNTLSTASSIELNNTYRAQINSRGDVDYFKIEIPQSGILNINITDVPSNIEMLLTMFRSDGTELDKWWGWAGQPIIFSQPICKAGIYWIKLEDNKASSQSSSELYSFGIFLDSSDQNECNNDFSEASIIQFCNPIKGFINFEEDRDYYAFNATVGDSLSFELFDVPSFISPKIYIVNPSRTEILHERENGIGQPININFNISETGLYYAVIEDVNQRWSSEEEYQFQILDKDCKLVSTVSQNTTEPVTIHPTPFTQKVYIESNISLSTQGLPVSVYNSFGKLVHRVSLQNKTNEIDLSSLPSGVYYFVFRDGNKSYSYKSIKL